MNDTLSHSQKILVVADEFRDEFTANELVVAAWKRYPATFGLAPFEYPDSHSVFWLLMGDKGLVKRGWLDRTGKKRYKMNQHGRQEVRNIQNGNGHARPLLTIRLRKPAEDRLSGLLLMRAVLRFRAGQRDAINLTDAMEVWRWCEPMTVEDVLSQARDAMVGGVVRLRSGQEVKAAELDEVGRVAAWLEKRFGREMERRKETV